MSQFSPEVGPTGSGGVCRNHPVVTALDRCAGCAEPFCFNCMVEMQGRRYCGDCKVMAVRAQPMTFTGPPLPCKEAGESLALSLAGIVGLFCFQIVGALVGAILEI